MTSRPPLIRNLNYRHTVWQESAACVDVETTVFFPEGTRGGKNSPPEVLEAAAKLVCADCPVKTECLEHALRVRELGIWGGTNEDERGRIRRQRDKARRAVA